MIVPMESSRSPPASLPYQARPGQAQHRHTAPGHALDRAGGEFDVPTSFLALPRIATTRPTRP